MAFFKVQSKNSLSAEQAVDRLIVDIMNLSQTVITLKTSAAYLSAFGFKVVQPLKEMEIHFIDLLDAIRKLQKLSENKQPELRY